MTRPLTHHYHIHYTVDGKPFDIELNAQSVYTAKAHLIRYRHKDEGWVDIQSCELIPEPVPEYEQLSLFDM